MDFFGLTWQFNALAKHPPAEVSAKAWERLRALTLWHETEDVGLVGRTFGVSRATLSRWRQLVDPHDLTSLR